MECNLLRFLCQNTSKDVLPGFNLPLASSVLQLLFYLDDIVAF